MDQAEPSAAPTRAEPRRASAISCSPTSPATRGSCPASSRSTGVDFSGGIPAAYGVLADLLNAVIEGVEPDFALVKLEGDAVFAAAPAATPRWPR